MKGQKETEKLGRDGNEELRRKGVRGGREGMKGGQEVADDLNMEGDEGAGRGSGRGGVKERAWMYEVGVAR